jgi:hypothetical protein
VTLKIGKQRELPKRPGDYRTAKGDMNAVPETAGDEAQEIRRRNNPPPPARKPDKKA